MKSRNSWARVLWVLNLTLVLLVGYLLVAFVRGPAASLPADNAIRPADAQTTAAAAPGGDVVNREELQGVFAESGPPPPVAVVTPPTAAATETLDLSGYRLLGAVAGDPKVARAVIAGGPGGLPVGRQAGRQETLPGGRMAPRASAAVAERSTPSAAEQRIYRINDSLAGGQVVEIGRSYVVVAKGNVRQRLEMHARPSAPGSEAMATSTDLSEAEARSILRILSENEVEVDRNAFQQRVGGIDALLNNATLEPYKEGEAMSGVRISGLDKVQMARLLGFRDGDVLQVVNGQKLTSMPKAIQVMRKARAQQAIDIRLLRDGEVKQLKFNLR